MSPTSVQRRKFLFEAKRLQTIDDFENAIQQKPGAAADYIELAHNKLGLTKALQLAGLALRLKLINANQYNYYQKQATRRSARLVRKDINNPREIPDDPSSAIAKPLPNEPEASIARCGARIVDDCKDFIMASDIADNLPPQRKAGSPEDFNVWVCQNCMTELYGRRAAKRQAEQQDADETIRFSNTDY